MPLVNYEPQIPDTSKFGLTKAAEILGITKKTLLKHTTDCFIKCGYARKTGRKIYHGSEIKRYWRTSI